MTVTPWNRVLDELDRGIEARKCHGCGCFHGYVEVLQRPEVAAGGAPSELAPRLDAARQTLQPVRYDCLGCEVCFPADGASALDEVVPGLDQGHCATAPVAERDEWPPLPGEYVVLDPTGSVAICCLTSRELCEQLGEEPPSGAAIVGLLFTENLGIERMVRNILSNPSIRGLVIVGDDSARRIGHQAGASLVALLDNGIDAKGRVIDAPGKRPWLKNLEPQDVTAFRSRVTVVTAIGETDADRVSALARSLAARLGPAPVPTADVGLEVERVVIEALDVPPLRLDPAGWFVIDPLPDRGAIQVEHFTRDGALNATLVGRDPAALVAECASRELLTRLDHAAYLGRELDRAKRFIDEGVPYRQDAAPDAPPDAQAPNPAPVPAPATPEDTGAACDAGCGCGPQDDLTRKGTTMTEPPKNSKTRAALLALIVLAVGAILGLKLLGSTPEAVAGEIEGPAWVLFKSPSCQDKKCAEFYSLVDVAEKAAGDDVGFYRPTYEEARELGPKLGVKATPCVVVLDKKEREVRRFEGESPAVFAALKAASADPRSTLR